MGFVDSDPVSDLGTEVFEAEFSVVSENISNVRIQPSTSGGLIVKCSGKIPMVKCDPWLDSSSEECIKYVVIEIDPLLVDNISCSIG